jgi:hypothetical protein
VIRNTPRIGQSLIRMHRALAWLLLLAGPLCSWPFSSAQALSCLPHDVARTYEQAARSEETFIVVHGTLTFDESRIPETDWQLQHKTPPNTLIPARLKGKALTRQGFEAPFNRPITFNLQCLGPWCASADSGTSYLAFLRKTDRPSGNSGSGASGFGSGAPGSEADVIGSGSGITGLGSDVTDPGSGASSSGSGASGSDRASGSGSGSDTGSGSTTSHAGRHTPGSPYQLDINACGGMGFAAPSQKVLETVVQCFKGGPCKPKGPRP